MARNPKPLRRCFKRAARFARAAAARGQRWVGFNDWLKHFFAPPQPALRRMLRSRVVYHPAADLFAWAPTRRDVEALEAKMRAGLAP